MYKFAPLFRLGSRLKCTVFEFEFRIIYFHSVLLTSKHTHTQQEKLDQILILNLVFN